MVCPGCSSWSPKQNPAGKHRNKSSTHPNLLTWADKGHEFLLNDELSSNAPSITWCARQHGEAMTKHRSRLFMALEIKDCKLWQQRDELASDLLSNFRCDSELGSNENEQKPKLCLFLYVIIWSACRSHPLTAPDFYISDLQIKNTLIKPMHISAVYWVNAENEPEQKKIWLNKQKPISSVWFFFPHHRQSGTLWSVHFYNNTGY